MGEFAPAPCWYKLGSLATGIQLPPPGIRFFNSLLHLPLPLSSLLRSSSPYQESSKGFFAKCFPLEIRNSASTFLSLHSSRYGLRFLLLFLLIDRMYVKKKIVSKPSRGRFKTLVSKTGQCNFDITSSWVVQPHQSAHYTV